MNNETAINMKGTVVTIATSLGLMTLTKGDQFEAEMANNQMVYPDGVTQMMMTTGAARRQWMHRKLDAWIDGVEDES
jgi:hypothetical protein